MPRIHVKPALLTTTLGAKYTVPAGVDLTFTELSFNNNHTSAVDIEIHIVASGDSGDSTNNIIKIELQPKQHWSRSWPTLNLGPGGAIHAKATVTSVVVMMITALTEVNS